MDRAKLAKEVQSTAKTTPPKETHRSQPAYSAVVNHAFQRENGLRNLIESLPVEINSKLSLTGSFKREAFKHISRLARTRFD